MTDLADADAARAILVFAGAREEDVRIERTADGWVVAWRGVGAGATDATDETMDTPQEVAQALVRGRFAAPPAPEPTLAPMPPPEPPLADETAPNVEVEWVGEAEPTDVDFDLVDALSMPELEGPDLGAEIVDAEDEAASVAIFGDNLDQKRTAAIGLVVRIALERMPPWSEVDNARLIELRNFTLGVSEDRWPDDPAKREELDDLERTLRMITTLAAARDAKVAFLVSATREEVEAFDPEAGWG